MSKYNTENDGPASDFAVAQAINSILSDLKEKPLQYQIYCNDGSLHHFNRYEDAMLFYSNNSKRSQMSII